MKWTVNWTIEVDANDPVDAARCALEIIRDPNSTAPCFDVVDDDGDLHEVDLQTDDPLHY